MRVLHVCAEMYPLIKSGGLADACAALPKALIAQGVDARVLLPALPSVCKGVVDAQLLRTADLLPQDLRIWRGRLPDNALTVYMVDAPSVCGSSERPYETGSFHPYDGSHLPFSALGIAAWRIAAGDDSSWSPQIVHAHDWHAGLAPAYLWADELASGRRHAASVFTIHNLAYQGNFPGAVFESLGLPRSFFAPASLEFHGQVSFMRAGIACADEVMTVSPTYAREVQGAEQGCGMDGILRTRGTRMNAILNGVDPAIWNPMTDPWIAARYSSDQFEGKLQCRRALQNEFGLASQTERPIFAIASRLAHQKGLDLVLECLPQMIESGAQLVVVGKGDDTLGKALIDAARTYPGFVGVHIGYEESIAHRLVAGADVVLMPSRFEPCGLTQLYGLKYGTLPLVRRTGGLADTVVDASPENLRNDEATGFAFERFCKDDFLATVARTHELFAKPSDWRRVQRRGMALDLSWDLPAKQHLDRSSNRRVATRRIQVAVVTEESLIGTACSG